MKFDKEIFDKEINETVAKRVLDTVDAGLCAGVGNPTPGQMCVEAAVCFALGLPHGDDPKCVSRALRSLKIKLNDSNWSSDKARAKGLRRLALAQLGSAGVLDDKEFAKRVAEMTIRKIVPIALRAAAKPHKSAEHKEALNKAADNCERTGTLESALAARKVATYATYAAYAAAYAAAADAAANAAAADAVDAAANAAAADAAADAANADAAKKRDEVLGMFAEEVVQILVEMGAPGCRWLSLTE